MPSRHCCPHRRGIVLLCICLSAMWAFLAAESHAQRAAGIQLGRIPTDSASSYLVLPSTPRELRQALIQAERSQESEQYSDAVEILAEILGRPDSEDFFIQGLPQDGTASSLKARAMQMLGSMPKAGRDIYELQYGIEARRLLDEAVANHDIHQLNEVSRRFFHTEASYDATYLLGRYHLDQDQPLTAALFLQRLEKIPRGAARFDPELSFLLAICWRMANMPEKAADTLVRLKERTPNAKLHVAGQQIAFFQSARDALPWLERLLGQIHKKENASGLLWSMHRGDPARNLLANGGMPLPDVLWRVRTAEPSQDKYVRELYQAYVDQEQPVLPCAHPLAIHKTILFRSPHHLFGIDVQTGKRIWKYPAFPDTESDRELAGSQTRNSGQPSEEVLLRQRTWEDSIYGQLSSDGERVFIVHRLNGAQLFNGNVQMIINGRLRTRSVANSNQLVALEVVASEGKLAWAVGGKDSDDPQLSEAFFLGAPLPLADRLYAIAELADEIKLVALDATTGYLVWSQQLAQLEIPNSLANDATRRLAGASPSFADGVLVCPSSAGAVVGVDLATRSLLWGYQYPRSIMLPRQQNNPFAARMQLNMPKAGDRWTDATATIGESRVVLTPIESNQLHCLDLVTGIAAWQPIPRRDGLYVAGIHRGKIIVVGSKSIRAINLSDGKNAWDSELSIPNEGMPSGRGFLNGDDLFLPTSENEVLRIDTTEGRLVESTQTEHPLGNLVCYRDQVFSQGHNYLDCFYQRDRLRETVPPLLAAQPNNPQLIDYYAQLLADEGKFDEAIGHFRRALESYPIDAPRRGKTRVRLAKTLLDYVETDFTQLETVQEEILGLIDDPRQRMRYDRIVARGLEERGDLMRAVSAYLSLAANQSNSQSTESTKLPLEKVGDHVHMRNDIWVGSNVRRLYEKASPQQKRQLLEKLLEQFSTLNDGASKDQFVELFGSAGSADKIRADIADKAIADSRLLKAERILLGLQRSTDTETSGSSALKLAELYHEQEKDRVAKRQYETLARRWNDQTIRDGVTARGIAVEGIAALSDDEPDHDLLRWNSGRIQSAWTQGQRRTASRNRYNVEIVESVGVWPEGNQVLYDPQTSSLSVHDPHGGQVIDDVPCGTRSLIRYPSYSGLLHAKTLGHLLVVSLGSEILAIDTLSEIRRPSDRLLWRVSLHSDDLEQTRIPNQIKPFPRPNPWTDTRFVAVDENNQRIGVLGPVTENGICYQRKRELRCVDPQTGETRWFRRDLPVGCALFGTEKHVYALPAKSTQARVFDMADGQEIGIRKVPAQNNQWTTRGQYILAWDDTESGKPQRLYLYDAWDERRVWVLDVPFFSRGALVGLDEIAVHEPTGRLRILELMSGSIRIDEELTAFGQQIKPVYVFRSKHQYTVITNHEKTQRTPQAGEVFTQYTPGGPQGTPMITGEIHTFDRATGKAIWQVPAKIEQYGLPLQQPCGLPVLSFIRYVQKIQQRVPNRAGRIRNTNLLCLDCRTGGLIFEKTDITPYAQFQSVYGDANDQHVTVELRGGHKLRIDLTKEPCPPQPPVQFDDVAEKPPGNALRRVAGAALKALGEGFAAQRIPPVKVPAIVDEQQEAKKQVAKKKRVGQQETAKKAGEKPDANKESLK